LVTPALRSIPSIFAAPLAPTNSIRTALDSTRGGILNPAATTEPAWTLGAGVTPCIVAPV